MTVSGIEMLFVAFSVFFKLLVYMNMYTISFKQPDS